MLRRILLVVATLVSVEANSTELSTDGALVLRFEQLQRVLMARQPIPQLRPYFSDKFLRDYRRLFDYEFLDDQFRRVTNSSKLSERIRGAKGCLAYAVPYKAKGDWIELSTFTYAFIDGEWLISSVSHSISGHRNVVESGDFCASLGWPWK